MAAWRSAGQMPLVLAVLLGALAGAAWPQEALTGADWELRALGVRDAAMLRDLAALARARPVTLAIVGTGGISRSLLEPLLVEGNTFEYRTWPQGQPADTGENTHDTQAAHVILSITSRLGIAVHLLSYQPGEPVGDVAANFQQAASEADIVALYQSFWGDVGAITAAIEASPGALFISPYVEVGPNPTSTCPQGSAAKPWAEGLAHFVTVIPAARSAPGELLTPLARPEDSEAVNFVAPSYYASGAGGTCPSAEVAVAVAAYIVAASPTKPAPTEIVQVMRETSCVDREALTTLPEFTDDAISQLETRIAALHGPPEGTPRKLDAPGLLSLRAILERLRAAR
jgi:hypothetical protein